MNEWGRGNVETFSVEYVVLCILHSTRVQFNLYSWHINKTHIILLYIEIDTSFYKCLKTLCIMIFDTSYYTFIFYSHKIVFLTKLSNILFISVSLIMSLDKHIVWVPYYGRNLVRGGERGRHPQFLIFYIYWFHLLFFVSILPLNFGTLTCIFYINWVHP